MGSKGHIKRSNFKQRQIAKLMVPTCCPWPSDLNYKIEIDDKNIEKVEITKFLGVLIDNNLSWKAHTMHISKIVSKYNGIIRKIRPYLNKDSLLTLYNTLVLPYLSYCTLIWGDKNNSFTESLFILQKKLIRTCTYSLWLEHTTPLFLALNKLKIRDIYTYQLAIHMYRFYHDLLPPDLPNVTFTTQSEIHNYNTRQVLNLHIVPSNTQLAKNTIKTQGPLIWNTLNTHIKNSASLGQFKKSLKKHRHVNATKSYLHFCCFAGEAILYLKPYFIDCWKFKRKEKLNKIKILLFLYDINDLLFLIQNH